MMTIKAMPSVGTDREDCCRQAIELAARIHAAVEFDYNGVTVIAYPKDDPERLDRVLLKVMKKGGEIAIARME